MHFLLCDQLFYNLFLTIYDKLYLFIYFVAKKKYMLFVEFVIMVITSPGCSKLMGWCCDWELVQFFDCHVYWWETCFLFICWYRWECVDQSVCLLELLSQTKFEKYNSKFQLILQISAQRNVNYWNYGNCIILAFGKANLMLCLYDGYEGWLKQHINFQKLVICLSMP